MTKRGDDKNARALDSLADMGQAVLSGAISTFLAVVVLLFSSSYVFVVLSTQFALTVALGVIHGLVLLPVMLSVVGPKAHGAEKPLETKKMDVEEEIIMENATASDDKNVLVEQENIMENSTEIKCEKEADDEESDVFSA